MIGGWTAAWRRVPAPARVAIVAALALLGWKLVDSWLQRGAPPGILLRGLVVGGLYSLGAMGLVLVWRANGIINMAQAELGSVAAVTSIVLVQRTGLNYFAAVALGLVVAAGLGAAVQVTVIRRLRRAPRLILTVATIGVAQILAGLALLIPLLLAGPPRPFETPFSVSFTVDPIVFNGNHLMVLLVVPLAMVAIATFLRRTDAGIAIRAAADNEDRASLVGIPVQALSTLAWTVAAVLSAVAVVLRVPVLGFASFQSVSGSGNALLLRMLAAAVIGRMQSMPTAAAAAVGIGVFEELASSELSNTNIVDAILVAVILAALLLQRGRFDRAVETGISSWRAVREVRAVPSELRDLPEVRWLGRGLRWGLLAVAVSLPLWARPSEEKAVSYILIYGIVAISLLILTGWSGQISLGQFALVGFGGATTALLYGRHGWDFLLAVPVGVAVAAGVAVVIGLPALRIRGPFLAVTTLAFAVTSSTYFLSDRYFPWFIERRIEPPVLWGRIDLGTDWVFYMACLGGLVLAIVAARNLRAGRPGRAIMAVRDNELAAATVTVAPTRTKLLAFALSGGFAGFAGSLYVVAQGGVFTDAYDAEASIRLFSMVVIGGLGSVPGAVLGAAYIRSAEFFLPSQWALIASGAGILFLLLVFPEGIGGAVYRVRDAGLRVIARRRGIVVPSLLADRRLGEDGGGGEADGARPASQGAGAPAEPVAEGGRRLDEAGVR